MIYFRLLKNVMLCLALLMSSIVATAQMKEDIRTEIEKVIYYDTEILSKNIPGYSIGIIYLDSVFIYHFGNADIEKTEHLKDNSIFELGGLSKVLTASLIEILVQAEVLDYEKPFNEYLDSTYRNDNLAKLTISDLITHQSSFPKLPYEFGTKEKEANNPYAHYTKEDLLDFYKSYTIPDDYKKEYAYSNINFALLEIAIENATGLAFEKALTEKLLDPIQMDNTFVHIDKEHSKMPTPGFSISGNSSPPFKFQSFAASEGIKSTMNDLIKFVKINIGEEQPDLSTKLANTHLPIADTNHNKFAKIAKGWHVLKLKKYYNVILHSGSTNGHRAYIGFVKETKTGVVVLSNSEQGFDGVGQHVLRMLNHEWKKKKK